MNQPARLPSRSLVTIENREKISITGIKQVDSFDESEISAHLENCAVSVYGQGLHISRLDLDNGILVVDGFITGVEYSDLQAHQGILSRLFK
ncbi:MAG: sporulation protein YabP [Clostridiales bacterium]|nr:sporulation protein YabP [Clostridiales bacterium]